VDGSVAGQRPAAHRVLPHYFSRAVHPLSAGLLVALAWPLWQRRAGSYASAARIIAEHPAGGAASVGGFTQATLRGVMSLVLEVISRPYYGHRRESSGIPALVAFAAVTAQGRFMALFTPHRTDLVGLAERGFALGTSRSGSPLHNEDAGPTSHVSLQAMLVHVRLAVSLL
jgi:hypothetical protein